KNAMIARGHAHARPVDERHQGVFVVKRDSGIRSLGDGIDRLPEGGFVEIKLELEIGVGLATVFDLIAGLLGKFGEGFGKWNILPLERDALGIEAIRCFMRRRFGLSWVVSISPECEKKQDREGEEVGGVAHKRMVPCQLILGKQMGCKQ